MVVGNLLKRMKLMVRSRFSESSHILYTMGRSDVRFIPASKAELKRWWDKLDHNGRIYVESKLGRLVPLLDIDVQSGAMQALAHFWCPHTSTFVFGKYELAPTLEKYSFAIGKPLDLDLINPPLGIDPQFLLSDFLKVTKIELTKILKDNCHACPFSFLDRCFENAPTHLRNRIFILVFFGFIIFPFRKNAIDPSIAWVVKQVCSGVNFVNAILAETFLSLTRFKKNEEKIFHAPIKLLQVWFFSHTKGFAIHTNISGYSESIHPIEEFKVLQNRTPDLSFSKWLNLLRNPKAKFFLWQARWFRAREARLSHGDDGPIPLIGITGITSYYPLRIVRQFRVLQDLPPPPKPDLFRLNFTNKGDNFMEEFHHIEQAWHNCHAQSVIWPEDELEGKQKIHHATIRYIRKFKFPDEWLPKIPDVTAKPTREAETKRYKRKAEELEEQMKKVARENRQLRRALASHLYIERAK